MRFIWLLLFFDVSLFAATCDVTIVDQGGRSRPSATFSALHYQSTFRIYVKTTTPDCKWSVDAGAAPPWLSFQVANGAFLRRERVGFTGPAVLDVTFAANTGYARSGKFTVYAPTYEIRSFVDQRNRTAVCLHTPVTADATEAARLGEGEFLLLLRRWGGKKVTSPRTIWQVTDSSGCPADGILYATTFGFEGSTIITTGVYQKGQPIVINTPYVAPNAKGEGAVFGLRGNGGNVGPSAIGTIVLPAATTLPPDLMITRQGFLPAWAVFASSGGVIELGGAVTRSTTDPKRRCAFEPSLYTVVAGGQNGIPWVSIVPASTRCLGGNPDKGIVALAAGPNRTGGPRYAIIFDAWGWATMIVQASGD